MGGAFYGQAVADTVAGPEPRKQWAVVGQFAAHVDADSFRTPCTTMMVSSKTVITGDTFTKHA